MTKRKMPFFFTFKGLSNKPFFNSSIFHFIGTLRRRKLHLAKTANTTIDQASRLRFHLKGITEGIQRRTEIRHRATKDDFRHQEMDSLPLWSMQHVTLLHTMNNPPGAEIMTSK